MKFYSLQCYLKYFVVGLILSALASDAYAQQKSGKKENSVQNTGGVYKSKSTNKKARRGGRNTLPIGIEGKKINIGVGTGIAIPGLSLSTEEHVTLGSNSHLYAHYLINGRSTFGVGINSNFIFLGSNRSNFYSENQNLTYASVKPWSFFTISPSLLINFTIQQRTSGQFLINGGPLMANVPQNKLTFIDSIIMIGSPTIGVKRDYVYQSGLSTGWFLSGAFQFNYALSRHLEVRVGLDYFYGRFYYQQINISNPLAPIKENRLRELKLIDLFTGLAFSF